MRSYGTSTLAHVLMDHGSEQKQKKDCHWRFGCWIDVSFIQTWADINLPGCPFLHRSLFMIYDPSHNTHSSHSSCPLRAYPYSQIRSAEMETRAHNLLLDTFCSDQSLFGCRRGGFKVLQAGIWELRTCVCVWQEIFRVGCLIHSSFLMGEDSYCVLVQSAEGRH